MGGWLTSFWWGGDPDVRDPRSGLSRRHVQLVRTSWAPIYSKRVKNVPVVVCMALQRMGDWLTSFWWGGDTVVRDPRSGLSRRDVDLARTSWAPIYSKRVKNVLAVVCVALQRMGGWLTSLWWGGDPDVRDPRSGLSRRHVHLVRTSWAPIYSKRVKNFLVVVCMALQRMGGWLTSFWWGGDPDVRDPRSGMSRRDVDLARTSWEPIYSKRVKNVLAVVCVALQRMGGWLTSLWWGGDPDVRDPRSGLSRRDVYLVRTSWAPIYSKRVENGTEILRRLFKASPEIKDHFKMLHGVPEDEFGQKFQFTAHVINLMSSINTVVQSLDQPQLAAAMLEKVGESHNKRKIPIRHFEVLKTVLVKLFEELGFDATTMGAWGRTVSFLYKHIYPAITFEEQR